MYTGGPLLPHGIDEAAILRGLFGRVDDQLNKLDETRGYVHQDLTHPYPPSTDGDPTLQPMHADFPSADAQSSYYQSAASQSGSQHQYQDHQHVSSAGGHQLQQQAQAQEQQVDLSNTVLTMQHNADLQVLDDFVYGITSPSEPLSLPPYNHPNASPATIAWLNEIRDQTIRRVCNINALNGHLS